MKLAIIGSPEFDDYSYMKKILDYYLKAENIDEILTNDDSRGTAILVKKYAQNNEIECQEYKAHWTKHGRAAGVMRNKNLVKNCNILIVFRLSSGSNQGVDDAIERANIIGRDAVVCDCKSDVLGDVG